MGILAAPRKRVPVKARLLRLLCRAAIVLAAAACEVKGDVHYRGEINAENNRRFFAQVADGTPQRMIVDSPGGEVEAGIALGHWVFTQGIDLVVDGECLSSCANYVFTAARRKTVLPGSVVGWHGNYHHLEATGLWRDDVGARVRRTGEEVARAERAVRAQVERLVAIERAFFDAIGVDQQLCWIGKQPPYAVPGYYTLSAADMARFGVFHVTLPEGYAGRAGSALDPAVLLIALDR